LCQFYAGKKPGKKIFPICERGIVKWVLCYITVDLATKPKTKLDFIGSPYIGKPISFRT
jgi:hypothetical protein